MKSQCFFHPKGEELTPDFGLSAPKRSSIPGARAGLAEGLGGVLRASPLRSDVAAAAAVLAHARGVTDAQEWVVRSSRRHLDTAVRAQPQPSGKDALAHCFDCVNEFAVAFPMRG